MPKTFKVRDGLIALVALALCTLFLVAGVGLSAIGGLQSMLAEVNGVVVPSIRSLGEITEGQTAIRSSNRYVAALLDQDTGLEPVKDQVRRKQATWARIDAAWKAYEPLPRVPEEDAAWRVFVAQWATWRTAEQKLSDFIQNAAEGKQSLRGEAVRREYLQMLDGTRTAFHDADRSLARLIEINAGIARDIQQKSVEQSVAARNQLLAFSGLALVALILVGSLIVRRVLSTLGAEPVVAKALVERIAMGDLRGTVDLRSGDQSSLMAQQYKMQQGLRTMVTDIADGVSRATEAAHSLASAAEQVAIASETSSESAPRWLQRLRSWRSASSWSPIIPRMPCRRRGMLADGRRRAAQSSSRRSVKSMRSPVPCSPRPAISVR